MAFCQVEDLSGIAEMVLFPDMFKKIKRYLESDTPLFCRVKTDLKEIEQTASDGEGNYKKINFVCLDAELLEQIKVGDDKPFVIEVEKKFINQ